MIGRRNFLRAAAVAPLAARKAAEAVLAGVSRLDVGGVSANYGVPQPMGGQGVTQLQWRGILSTVAGREEVRRVIYEDERTIARIDPDLAVLKSVSLSAKIAYQRERNVERRLSSMEDEWPWQKLETIGKRFIGI